jgi:hypothetical protein
MASRMVRPKKAQAFFVGTLGWLRIYTHNQRSAADPKSRRDLIRRRAWNGEGEGEGEYNGGSHHGALDDRKWRGEGEKEEAAMRAMHGSSV